MAQNLTRNLLTHIDFRGADLVLVKKPTEEPDNELFLKGNRQLPKKKELLVSTKKNIYVDFDGQKKNLSIKEKKIVKKVVNSVRVGVEKTKDVNNVSTNKESDSKDGKSVSKSAKKNIATKVSNNLLGSKGNSKDKNIKSLDATDLKATQKVSKKKSAKLLEKVNKKDIVNSVKKEEKEESKSVVNEITSKVTNSKKGEMEKHSESNLVKSNDPNLQSLLVQSQKNSFKSGKTEKLLKNADNLKTFTPKSQNNRLSTTKGFSLKQNTVSVKSDSLAGKNSFSNTYNHKQVASKDLVKTLERKFLKAMSFKKIVDKTKVKLHSKTQRMQITLGKSSQHTNILNSSVQSNVNVSNVSQKVDTANFQKPLSTDPNIIQRFENVQKISNMIKSLTPQNKVMMMRLDPPNLGSVEVRLVTHGKEVLVNFIVKDGGLKDVIKNSSQLLTAQLRTNTNYQKIQINVQSQDNQNQQFHQRNGNHNQQNQQQQRYYQQEEEDTEDDSQ